MVLKHIQIEVIQQDRLHRDEQVPKTTPNLFISCPNIRVYLFISMTQHKNEVQPKAIACNNSGYTKDATCFKDFIVSFRNACLSVAENYGRK